MFVGAKQLAFYGLTNICELSEILGSQITSSTYHHKYIRSAYRIHTEGKRRIEAPEDTLKSLQRAIYTKFKVLTRPKYLYTFRSAITNAAYHYSSEELLKLDISNFFPSCKSSRVFNLFRQRFKCSSIVSSKLTDLTCLERHLPTGAPSSPMLAFWAYKPMWDKAAEVCNQHNCKLTVYMDDLTISGKKISSDLTDSLVKVIQDSGFQVNPSKTLHYTESELKEVTGVAMITNDKFGILHSLEAKQNEIEALLGSPLSNDKHFKLQQSRKGILAYTTQVANQHQVLINS